MRFIVALLALLASDAALAQQQRQTFKDANGRTSVAHRPIRVATPRITTRSAATPPGRSPVATPPPSMIPSVVRPDASEAGHDVARVNTGRDG